MSDDEIDKAVKEAAEYEAQDKKHVRKPLMQETKLIPSYSRQKRH